MEEDSVSCGGRGLRRVNIRGNCVGFKFTLHSEVADLLRTFIKLSQFSISAAGLVQILNQAIVAKLSGIYVVLIKFCRPYTFYATIGLFVLKI